MTHNTIQATLTKYFTLVQQERPFKSWVSLDEY